MVDQDIIKHVLDMYLDGQISQEELSAWAYEIIKGDEAIEDPLVAEILFSLVGFTSFSSVLSKLEDKNETSSDNKIPPKLLH